ncbi:unnamed protein product [Lepidochelys kempii]
MPATCSACCASPAALRRPKTGHALCRACFLAAFEEETHRAIVAGRLFRPGETVAIGASGGKDSTVLAHLLQLLDQRHGYGLRLLLLSVDEGIAGYRDASLAAVRRHHPPLRPAPARGLLPPALRLEHGPHRPPPSAPATTAPSAASSGARPSTGAPC